MATIGRTHELNPAVIARKVEAQMWFRSPWSRFMGDIVADSKSENAGLSKMDNFTDRAIIKYTEFSDEGTDTVYVPQVRMLTDTPTYGDLQLEGNEESLALYRMPVYVNALAHAVLVRRGPMNTLRSEKRLRMIQEAAPALRRWFSNQLTYRMITKAFYEGFSENITASAVTGGQAITKRHHPNFFVADSGWVAWSTVSAAAYEDNIATALNTLDGAATDARAFSADLLDGLRPELVKKGIQPLITQSGYEYWPILVHPDVMAQARQDTRISQATERAYMGRGKESPILTGTELVYNSFIIIENILAGLEVHQTGSTAVLYGPTNSAEDTELNPLSNYQSTDAADRNMKVSLVLGQNALGIGQTNRLTLVTKDGAANDYDRKASVGGTLIVGAARLDPYDSISSPTAVDNRSSAVIATNSASLV